MGKQHTNILSLILAITFIGYLIPANADNNENEIPRTWHGQPDLQGIWYFGSTTPFTRPEELGEQAVYSATEAAELEQEQLASNIAADAPLDANRPPPEKGAYVGFEADFNFARKRHELQEVMGEYRTSLVVEPSNGQLPAREGFKDFHAQRRELGINSYDGPEAQDSGERCLVGGPPIPSLYPAPWNANLQIVQNENYVMLMTEMIHDARIVKLSGKHLGDHMSYWYGDAIGYWENDTLVVHSKNFRPEHSSFLVRMSDQLQTTERFTPLNQDEILYRIEVTDQEAYTEPFVVERVISRRADNEPIYEFACHEGNYSMKWVLTGARRAEVDAEFSAESEDLSK